MQKKNFFITRSKSFYSEIVRRFPVFVSNRDGETVQAQPSATSDTNTSRPVVTEPVTADRKRPSSVPAKRVTPVTVRPLGSTEPCICLAQRCWGPRRTTLPSNRSVICVRRQPIRLTLAHPSSFSLRWLTMPSRLVQPRIKLTSTAKTRQR